VSIELRDAGSRPATSVATEELLAWLRESLIGASAAKPTGALPFESSQLDFNGELPWQQLRPSDRLVAAGWALLFLICLALLAGFVEKLYHVRTSGVVGVSGVVALGIYNNIIFKRARQRAKQSDSSGAV